MFSTVYVATMMTIRLAEGITLGISIGRKAWLFFSVFFCAILGIAIYLAISSVSPEITTSITAGWAFLGAFLASVFLTLKVRARWGAKVGFLAIPIFTVFMSTMLYIPTLSRVDDYLYKLLGPIGLCAGAVFSVINRRMSHNKSNRQDSEEDAE